MKKCIIILLSLVLSLSTIACNSTTTTDITCNNCGNQITDISKFCSVCGTSVTPDSEEIQKEINECPIELVSQESTGTEDGYSHAAFTVKNVSGETIHTLTLDIKILDENQTVLSTTHPQEGVLISNGESIVIEALTEEGAYSMKLDGYSFYTGSDFDGEYVQGFFYDTTEVILKDETTHTKTIEDNSNTASNVSEFEASANTNKTEHFIEDKCFTYTARSFMERFDEAYDDVDDYNYMYMRSSDETLYYELVEGKTYDDIRTVGIVAFDNISGDMLSIDDDYTEGIINSVTILVEDVDDVPMILIGCMCGADPNLDFMTAYNIGEDVVECAGTEEGYTYNDVNYVVVTDDEYYYIIITVDTSDSVSSVDKDENAKTIETVAYSLNFAEFDVPDYFEHTDTDGNIMWFEHEDNDNNRIMVNIEKIPDYMKIDTGGENSIVTANDTVDFYIYDIEEDTISENWETTGELVYYEKYFSDEADYGTCYGRSIVIPINENERVIVIHALFEDEEYLSDIDIILESIWF